MSTLIQAKQLQNGDEVGFYYIYNDNTYMAYGTVSDFAVVDDDTVKFTVDNGGKDITLTVRNTFGINLHT